MNLKFVDVTGEIRTESTEKWLDLLLRCLRRSHWWRRRVEDVQCSGRDQRGLLFVIILAQIVKNPISEILPIVLYDQSDRERLIPLARLTSFDIRCIGNDQLAGISRFEFRWLDDIEFFAVGMNGLGIDRWCLSFHSMGGWSFTPFQIRGMMVECFVQQTRLTMIDAFVGRGMHSIELFESVLHTGG